MHSEKPPRATACGWRCWVSEQLRSRVLARDRFVGWSDEVHFRRLRGVANNQRFCVLPASRHRQCRVRGAVPCAHALERRLSGPLGPHPVLLVATCVDPAATVGPATSRPVSACWARRSATTGSRAVTCTTAARSSASHAPSGATPLSVLSAPFDYPVIAATPRRMTAVIDLNRLVSGGDDGLLARLGRIPDRGGRSEPTDLQHLPPKLRGPPGATRSRPAGSPAGRPAPTPPAQRQGSPSSSAAWSCRRRSPCIWSHGSPSQ